ncbi:MAG: ABC-type multidrug transport system ATPase component-like protein [Actinomycetia bacterium]|nr:ABC-type multidrug transport system ATPase component-like protein [Actinomycetes bacterium]
MKLRGRLAAITAVVAVMAGGGIAWGVTADDTSKVRADDQQIQVVDGPKDDQRISLDTTFFHPVFRQGDGGKAPAILLAHGFGGTKQDTRAEAEELARSGYAVLTWSARGFGKSTGEIALDSPDYEVKDVRQLIDWLARRPEVKLDKPGDPRVGIAGASYGGGISLMTAAYDSRVDAIAPQITWNDLADSLFPQGTGAGAQTGVFKKLWAGIFFTGANDPERKASSSPQAAACGRFQPSLCTMYQKIAETGGPTPEAVATLKRSSPSSVADRIKAPTLLIQGQADSLFPLDQADANAAAIRKNGAPVSVVWFQGGHDGGEPETSRVRGLVRGWFDHWLRGGPADTPAFTVTRTGGIDSSSQRVVIQAATAPTYPGLDAAPRTVALTGGEQTINNPAGGSPASISALPGLGGLAALSSLGGGTGGLSLDMAGQSATFDSAPLTAALQITGAPRVRIKVNGPATLFAKLYDVAPGGGPGSGGQAGPTRRIAAPLRVTAAGEADVALPAIDYTFERGHRLRVVLATTDMGFATPAKPAAYTVSVVSGLSVPTVPALTSPAPSPPWWVWALPLAALVVALAIVLAGRRRTSGSYDSTLTEVPLEITGLTKAYSNGHLAVDDLSFQVEKGQVLGLLGPNGAGKTTTLRMLMGLIHPDAGEIRIFGQRITPGAPVLARLGSFVEGPGFLPHLTGRVNLDLYWRATGRPAEESHVDEAVAIADLGTALDRPVRTYSQGMRQRLAIAQAMLGMPDLLVLDEPTNGLDPPQIREMRDVLVRYAAEGRTVIVSSHLLAEVEQTCTNVVVMFRGRKVADGPVAEITGDGRRLEDAFLAIIGEGV